MKTALMKRLDADRFFLSRLKGFSNCNYHFVFSDKGKNFLKSVARFSSLIITETQLLKQRSRLVLSCCWVFIGKVWLRVGGLFFLKSAIRCSSYRIILDHLSIAHNNCNHTKVMLTILQHEHNCLAWQLCENSSCVQLWQAYVS